MVRRVVGWLVLALLLAACVTSSNAQRQPEAVDDGVQATGRLGGQRVAISDGSPETSLSDCDPGGIPDRDVCWVARTIHGTTIAFVIENPGALVAGEAIEVDEADCETCDDVRGHAVVDLRINGDQRRAVGGRLVVEQAGERYAASFDIELPGADTLTGSFNIREYAPSEQ